VTRLAPVQRGSQIRELTRGLQLPLADLSNIHLTAIIENLVIVWGQLIQRHGEELLRCSEEELNSYLVIGMNYRREADGIFSQIVSAVGRQDAALSYDGRHIEKRPDIAIFLTNRNTNFPLSIECKIIDRGDGKTIALYCSNGIRRFVDGEYAWALRQGVMLAYVRDSSSVELDLTPHLEALAADPPDVLRTEGAPMRRRGSNPPVFVSRHTRLFRYLEAVENEDPGPIGIWHVWLDLHA